VLIHNDHSEKNGKASRDTSYRIGVIAEARSGTYYAEGQPSLLRVGSFRAYRE